MKYTNESIEAIVEGHEKFTDHVESVMCIAGIRYDSILSFDGVSGGQLHITTTRHTSCGADYENRSIPLEWLTAEDPEVLKSKIEAKRAEDHRITQERYQQERLASEARQKATDLETLARLKSKYEPTNQGETP